MNPKNEHTKLMRPNANVEYCTMLMSNVVERAEASGMQSNNKNPYVAFNRLKRTIRIKLNATQWFPECVSRIFSMNSPR